MQRVGDGDIMGVKLVEECSMLRTWRLREVPSLCRLQHPLQPAELQES